MFTGIVEEMGRVRSIIPGNSSIKLNIECTNIIREIKLGDSIAVNGICLTVTDFGKDWFTADVMPETMRMTNLNILKISENVNLERALRLSDRLGGHIVSGHIDGTGKIVEKKDEDTAVWLTIEASNEIYKYIIKKGSVALDGTSLTVACLDDKYFKVSLIPMTRNVTVLGMKRVGDVVNIECDVVGKYIEKLVLGRSNKEDSKSINEEFLRENGFM